MGAVKVLQELFPQPGRLQFIYADLGDPKAVFLLYLNWNKELLYVELRIAILLIGEFCWVSLIFNQVEKIFSENAFDAVMHFAAVAYVGESTLDPLK